MPEEYNLRNGEQIHSVGGRGVTPEGLTGVNSPLPPPPHTIRDPTDRTGQMVLLSPVGYRL